MESHQSATALSFTTALTSSPRGESFLTYNKFEQESTPSNYLSRSEENLYQTARYFVDLVCAFLIVLSVSILIAPNFF